MPDVGDYVRIEHTDYMPYREHIIGKVRSRYFNYVKFSENSEEWCIINIVIEATNDELGMILKS